MWVKKYMQLSNMDALTEDLYNYTNEWIVGHVFDDKIFTDVAPEGGSDLAAVSAQLNSYWAQQFPLIVMAETPEKATQIYNDTIAQMDKTGMAELDEYQNEQFQKNKERMQLEFAWPRNQ